MFKAAILVRNLGSSADGLAFGEFTISLVGLRSKEIREVFSSVDVNNDDWIFEKSYTQLPLGPPGSPVGGIPNDTEDILLLLRLYKAGDISFIRQAIIPPSGNTLVQFPYRAMNDLNSYSPLRFEVGSEECQSWKAFADGIRESASWRSDWFAAARRFFLSGGAKQFDPKSDDVDRIVDYATALESTLVPERDYNTRRISRRAAALIAPDNPAEAEGIRRFIKKFYEIRSRIVHGSGLGDANREWLLENCGQVERRVRQVLVTAVRKLPPGEGDRRAALAELHDPTDEDRGGIAFDKFREIKTAEIRKAIAAKIARLAGE
jgi:Apea-like HEPN